MYICIDYSYLSKLIIIYWKLYVFRIIKKLNEDVCLIKKKIDSNSLI